MIIADAAGRDLLVERRGGALDFEHFSQAHKGQHFAAQGIALIPSEAGADFFGGEVVGCAESGAGGEGVCGAGVGTWLPQAPQRGDSLRVEWWLNLGLHPWIGDHRVQGTPVLPIAMVGEFCTRAASLLAPGRRLQRASDLRALNGIRLTEDAPAWFEIGVTRASDREAFQCQISAAGAGGREHYRVTITFTAEEPAEVAPPANRT